MSGFGKGVWIDGKMSKEELATLENLIREVALKALAGKLPMTYEDEKIAFTANTVGECLHIFYGWKFPPKDLWVKEVKDPWQECHKCFPNGLQGEIGREVWCHRISYNYTKCPYGVETPKENPPTQQAG